MAGRRFILQVTGRHAPGDLAGIDHAWDRVSLSTVLRVKVRGERDLITVIGSAASITPEEFLEAEGVWVNDRQHGLQFKPPLNLDLMV